MKGIGTRIDDREAEIAIKVGGYKNLNQAAERATLSWARLKKLTLLEIKGKFTQSELNMIIDIHNGLIFAAPLYSENAKRMVMMSTTESQEYFKTADKWEVDIKNLLEKLSNLTNSQAFFLCEWAYQFWYENPDKKSFEEWRSMLE